MVTEVVTLPFYFLVLTYDFGEEPDLEDLNDYMEKEHIKYPIFHPYGDDYDTFVWIIAGHKLSKKELGRAYAAYQKA